MENKDFVGYALGFVPGTLTEEQKKKSLADHEELMKIEAIENFTADDITVEKGVEKQDVVIYETVQPVDAMEKLYMKVEVV